MKLRRWLLTTVVVGLIGCGDGGDDSGTIDGDPINPGGSTGANTGSGSTGTTGNPLPPTTGGNNPGTTTTGGSNTPDGGGPDVCEEQMVSSQRVTPDMLIVLDKSGSMAPGPNQPIDRWGGSVEALKAITLDLQKDINFGLMTYPSAGVSPIPGFPLPATCDAGKLDVPIAANNAGAISTALDGMEPEGGTPTSGTLQAAKTVIDMAVNPDGVVGPKFVLLVTDGSPNCRNGNAGGTGPDPQAVTDSVNAIKEMTALDIKTYVIGFQTAQDATLAAALNEMAAAGGTGDTMHRPVEDKDTLVKAFRDIAGQAVSCTFLLEKKPPRPDFVLVTVDGKQVNLNDANGWVLSPDGMQITLQGTACSGIQGSGQHTVNVKVKCEAVIPM